MCMHVHAALMHVHACRCLAGARLHVCTHGHCAEHVERLAVKAGALAHAHALTFADAATLALALIDALAHHHLCCLAAANAVAAATPLSLTACGCAQPAPQYGVPRLRCLRRRAPPRRRLAPRGAASLGLGLGLGLG